MPASWPSIERETHRRVHRDPMASHRARIRNTGDFEAAVIPEISSLTPDLPRDTLASAHNATAAMLAFDRESRGLASLPFAAVLSRGESATSSQIENLAVRARKLSLAAVGAHIGGNAELVARNVFAMRAAIDAAPHLDSDAIRTMHRVLTEGVQDDAGEYRKEWVWIGGESPVTAAYVAPEHSHIPAAIRDLINFLHRRDLDPTVQSAIAHAQFETIPPLHRWQRANRAGHRVVATPCAWDGSKCQHSHFIGVAARHRRLHRCSERLPHRKPRVHRGLFFPCRSGVAR